jgi:hypothetical protein
VALESAHGGNEFEAALAWTRLAGFRPATCIHLLDNDLGAPLDIDSTASLDEVPGVDEALGAAP